MQTMLPSESGSRVQRKPGQVHGGEWRLAGHPASQPGRRPCKQKATWCQRKNWGLGISVQAAFAFLAVGSLYSASLPWGCDAKPTGRYLSCILVIQESLRKGDTLLFYYNSELNLKFSPCFKPFGFLFGKEPAPRHVINLSFQLLHYLTWDLETSDSLCSSGSLETLEWSLCMKRGAPDWSPPSRTCTSWHSFLRDENLI